MRPKIELGDRNGLTEIKEEPSLNAADTQRIYEGLLAADPQGQPRRFAPLVLSLRDSEERLMGGVLAATAWNWLNVTTQNVASRGDAHRA